MPRTSRIDAPGAVQHVMVRGINRQPIFDGQEDQEDLLRRTDLLLREEGVRCYAWVLMPNHLHFLLQSGERPLWRFMHRLAGSYAQAFNRRHARTGHLFENRFKSKLVGNMAYLLELVRYIHLNPVRAGIVRDVGNLSDFAWSGHAELTGAQPEHLIDVTEVRSWFGDSLEEQLSAINFAMLDGLDVDLGALEREQAALPGSEAGCGVALPFVVGKGRSRPRTTVGEFGELALEQAEARSAVQLRLRLDGWTACRIVHLVAAVVGANVDEVRSQSRGVAASQCRALTCHLACLALGLTPAEVARELGISSPAVWRAVRRGFALLPEEEGRIPSELITAARLAYDGVSPR
jgi:putative transposase